MSKLYVIGIGGTGARVIRSLTMLLATGIEIKNTSEVVPVIIDADANNGNLTQTVELVKDYISLQDYVNAAGMKNKFFGSKINNIIGSIVTSMTLNTQQKFEDFIGYSGLDDSNKKFASMLFSGEEMNMNMVDGFQGHPNIGSVTLNQFSSIINSLNYQAGDRFFIVSSIFGGTGASGFPLLLKNLKNPGNDIQNKIVEDAKIGAITVMPYFELSKNGQNAYVPQNSDTFMSRTKAALKYYDNNINPDVLYYIGDDVCSQYNNCGGGQGQSNKAHFVELVSALSILDFMDITDKDMQNSGGTIYKEYGMKQNDSNVTFDTLDDTTSDKIKGNLTGFLLLSKFLNEHLKKACADNDKWTINSQCDGNFLGGDFYKKLKSFASNYMKWLEEMKDNTRSFQPLNTQQKEDELFDLVVGVKSSKMKGYGFNRNYDLFDAVLDEQKADSFKNLTKEQRFVEMFYLTIEELCKGKLNFNI